jgi:hypothetical protein
LPEAAARAAGEDEETARRFGWWPARSAEETMRAACASWAGNWRDDGPARAFAARDPERVPLPAAASCASAPAAPQGCPTGPTPASAAGGHASNALALLVGYAASIGVTRLEARVATGNQASRRVAESGGFSQAGTFTDDDGTEMIRYTRQVPRPPASP